MISTGKINIGTIFLGIILGLLAFFARGTLVMLVFIALAGLSLKAFLPIEDRSFLLKIFLFGISLRILLFAVFYILTISQGGFGELIPDSRLYSIKALNMMRNWLSDTQIPLLGDERVRKEGHLFILSFFYMLIGHNPSMANPVSLFSDKLINCLISTLTALPVYYLSKEVFNRRIARIAALLVVFYPTLVLWSMSNLREPVQIFLSSLALLFIVLFQRSLRISYLLLIILIALLLKTIRNYTFYLTLAVVPVAYFMSAKLSFRRKLAILVVLLVITGIFLNFTQQGMVFKNTFLNFRWIVERISTANTAILTQPGSNYQIYEEGMVTGNGVDTLKFFSGFMKGWIFFMLVPFPWAMNTALQLLTYPAMIAWYILIPFIMLGVIIAWRYKFKASFALIFYVISLSSMYALTEGNIGSALRHRDLIAPICFIFGAAGLVKFLYGSAVFEEESGPSRVRGDIENSG